MDTITLDTAQALVAAALAAAKADYGKPVCVAVCDGVGNLLAFARADGAPPRSIQIAQDKAYTAARMGVDTDAFHARLKREEVQARDFCDARLTALLGGAVLKSGAGAVVGGIGVSGLASAEDHAIVQGLARRVAADDI
ncbi:heme-binding protein [Rhodoplanes sp. TEM]|uniref:Heme-binding protein n=1 Tax=Rhodoplanes tepidamans TaxID=200616 RepID=A0ABT5JJR9_RHOTP|nr:MULTISPECIES: heme-binding protein [Rhodoplanes]MDC7789603.1 heme-binding protein [Rhodoplanes tepidamans]MDC7987750.1 heme-binding protein [Rhodoplanes sp. TEM]MDQ0354018.1 uncharacterized protein GlcG (DUF336 family) [Rhodoplanes tepidamans]